MGTSLDQIIRPDVDNVAADGTGRVESKRLVLVSLVNVEFLRFVDGSLVHSVGNGGINEFTASKVNKDLLVKYRRRWRVHRNW